MRKTGTCPKCKSTRIINDANVKARNIAYVCLDCGFTEFYASEKQIELLVKLKQKGKL